MDGTNTMLLIAKYQVPEDRIKDVTYGPIIVDYWPKKQEPHRARLTVGGNFTFYAGDVSTPTADITTAKITTNRTISTPGARYMCCDIKNFYLGTPMS